MTLSRFARMCEVLENNNGKADIIEESLSAFTDVQSTLKILSLDFESNNIGSKRAISWIATALGVFEVEIKAEVEAWGDLAEGLNQFMMYEDKDSNISMSEFHRLLELDCSSMSNN